MRLLHYAKSFKLLSESRISRIEAKQQKIQKWISFFEEKSTKGGKWAAHMRRQDDKVELPAEFLAETDAIRSEVIYRVVYQGYLEREQRQILKLDHIENIKLPADIDYKTIKGLRKESALKLTEFKPQNLGQASRISGVNPADVSILMIYIESSRGGKKSDGNTEPND